MCRFAFGNLPVTTSRFEQNTVEKLIQLLESPIPAAPAAAPASAPAPPSQKASSDDISGTKRGTIDRNDRKKF